MSFTTQFSGFLLAVATLWHRELVRFYRQRGRVVGALGTPLVFWILIGSGFGRSFRMPGSGQTEEINYLEYFFPGTVILIVLFTAIFSTISLIEDRREGFLLSVLVAPVSRPTIVLGSFLSFPRAPGSRMKYGNLCLALTVYMRPAIRVKSEATNKKVAGLREVS